MPKALPVVAIGDLAVDVPREWAVPHLLGLELACNAKTPHRHQDFPHPAVVLVLGCTLHGQFLSTCRATRGVLETALRSRAHWRLRLLATLVSPAPDPVLELPIGLVEGSVSRRVRVLEAGAVGWGVAGQKLATRKPDIDGDAIPIAVAMMVTR
jgi:hypothetical protein